MRASYRHVDFRFEKSFQLQRFDGKNPCEHSGLHLHHVYEIVYVKNGKGTIKIEGKEINYSDGTLVFLGPSIPHFGFSNTAYDNNFEVVIHLDKSFISDRIGMFPEFSNILKLTERSKRVLVFDYRTKVKFSSFFDRITHLNEADQLISIFHLLSKLSKEKNPQSVLNKDFGEHYAQSKQITKVFNYLNENYQKQISSKDMANEVGLTTNSFCRIFKKLTGKPFITYLKEYRIHRAAVLLRETEDPVSDIMQECGFDNPSYFAKVFIEIKKLQPIQYRKRFRDLVE